MTNTTLDTTRTTNADELNLDISEIIGLVTNEELAETADQVEKLLTQPTWRVMNMVAFD